MARPVAVDRSVLGLTYLVLFAAAALSAVIEAFLVPQRVGGHVGLSLVMAVVINIALGALGGIGTRTWQGAVVPVIAWVAVILTLSMSGPGGDIILPGSLGPDPAVAHVTTAFLLVGVLAGGIGLVLTLRYTGRVNPPTQPE